MVTGSVIPDREVGVDVSVYECLLLVPTLVSSDPGTPTPSSGVGSDFLLQSPVEGPPPEDSTSCLSSMETSGSLSYYVNSLSSVSRRKGQG